MNYLFQEDVLSTVRNNRLAHILDDDGFTAQEIFGQAVEQAKAIIKDYLTRYEIEEEYSKTGHDRHGSILFYVKNITLYILYERIDDENVPERIIKDYNDTMTTLNEIAQGKLPISLPLKQIDTDGDGKPDKVKTKFRWGSAPLREY